MLPTGAFVFLFRCQLDVPDCVFAILLHTFTIMFRYMSESSVPSLLSLINLLVVTSNVSRLESSDKLTCAICIFTKSAIRFHALLLKQLEATTRTILIVCFPALPACWNQFKILGPCNLRSRKNKSNPVFVFSNHHLFLITFTLTLFQTH